MYIGRTLSSFAQEIVRQKEASKDFHVRTRYMQMENGRLAFGDDSTRHSYHVNNIAGHQLASYTGIPSAYYIRMRDTNPALLDTNINSWLSSKEDEVRMIRTLDGNCRAFLSDIYHPYDNHAIAMRVLPIISDIVSLNDNNVSCEITDRKMFIKVINYKVQGEVTPGDVVQAGIIVSNSEVGAGMVEIKPFMHRLVCMNGMVIDLACKKRRHVGKTIDIDSNGYEVFRPETVNAANEAFMMQIEDTVSSAMNEVQFDKILDSMREAKDRKFTNNNMPAVVELATKKYGIPEGAADNILTHLIKEGDTSVYGLANAITRYSQDVDNYDDATELETIGGKMINMPESIFRELNATTTTKAQRKIERKQNRERQAAMLATAA